MMKRRDAARQVLGLVLASALTIITTSPARAAGSPNAVGAIRSLLAGSAAAWNRGDLTTFMQSYERSPDTVYISARTVIHGYANIRAHYVAGYQAAMGTLMISDVAVRPLGPDYAVAVARWHLAGAGGSRNTGLFTLVLHRTAPGWKIITDHSP
jgi:uncharacterized protein (TIGR02246 family)